MSSLSRYAKYLVSSPKLYKIYTTRLANQQTQVTVEQYKPPFLESLSDAALTYLLPVTLLLTVYNRKVGYLQLTIILYVASRILRSFARLTNPVYLDFLSRVDKANEAATSEALDEIRKFDFEFRYFPVVHSCTVSVSDFVNSQPRSSGLMYYASWLVAHTFGIRLIYPGLILGSVLRNVLEEGRGKYVTEKHGVRVKIAVSSEHDSVQVDAMVFDKRGSGGNLSNTLVICCEGNAGFYEIGMLGGALSEGYSVLGWNHPGFGGSTGTPYPAAELTAALGVMDYAINVLGFKESRIVVYGWSIGGFPAAYLASRFPKIRGLLLDATFDDILPLALPRMPEFMAPLVVATIRSHVNLDNAALVTKYNGPLRLVRRSDDEIIADPPASLSGNRGNFLLEQVVEARHPTVISEPGARAALSDWMNATHDTDVSEFDSLERQDPKMEKSGNTSGLVVQIASSYLRDYKSTHCTPLPKEFYRIRNA